MFHPYGNQKEKQNTSVLLLRDIQVLPELHQFSFSAYFGKGRVLYYRMILQ